ncbi:hypothetical protein ACF07Q_10620 [Nocardiopsis dassonvillei]|uniref:hypothetical protein n=1 Tax=Nocardiopsis dassonvillei TaxID=2014 RepID=UPI0036FDDA7A
MRHRQHTDSYINNQHRCLQQFFRWLSAEEEIPNPRAKMHSPKIAPKPVSVFDQEIAGLRVGDVSIVDRRAVVTDKGS